ncbi:tRNAHis Guanylyltransferase [Oopsacas minuta]|uniref:tRNA(His) guanylyltransferase n=1 Tax=Oopsacas minuta TaxID=111878 RepID=A0AAV7JF83_9METZ|nr:tRNAHis Guanylyltransferase [Oopsacas minuta]
MLSLLRLYNTTPQLSYILNPHKLQIMAKSRFEYVKKFEQDDRCLLGCWIVVRIDGRSFHKFTSEHLFAKPNDLSALKLMDVAACSVMEEFRDIIFAYGQSDEYSFIFDRKMSLFNRRSSKILTNLVSLFTSSYTYNWRIHFPNTELKYPPAFDGRVVLYPNTIVLKDYLSWRQADCHINNLYNTAFWEIVKSGKSHVEAAARLKDTFSSGKNEILFSEFGINYNKIEPRYRKGSCLFWIDKMTEKSPEGPDTVGEFITGGACKKPRVCREITVSHEDIISEVFWSNHPQILGQDIVNS